jgi:serine phosphatase RsbU (regulator of sigma subunit)
LPGWSRDEQFGLETPGPTPGQDVADAPEHSRAAVDDEQGGRAVPAQHEDAHAREGRLLGAILDEQHVTAPSDLAAMVAQAAEAEGLADLALYLQDYDQLALLPLPTARKDHHEMSIDGSVPGRAFVANTPVEVPVEDGGARLWLPMLDGTDRIGVLGVTVDRVDDDVRRLARRLTGLVAELLVTKGQYTDHFFRVRRRKGTTLAAEMQWHLLPPLMLETSRVAVAGIVEPAYEVGGDSFDYALNGDVLHVGIFDAMGHGLRAATMCSVVVGAFRHARRNGIGLQDKYACMDEAVADQFGADHFATAQFAHLDTGTGRLEWVNAGHPRPLLVRDGRPVRSLKGTTTLPIGVGGEQPEINSEQLEPGDRVLLFTDGVVEQEAADGDQLGFDRLAEHLERQCAAGTDAAETVRRLAATLIRPDQGLRDDATLLLVEWKGRDASR